MTADGSASGDGTRPAADPNRIRDHLANERTFLAWIRTALGLIGLGFVLARMGLFLGQLATASGERLRHRLPAGPEFMVTGIVFLILGTALCGWTAWLYHRVRRAIDDDEYGPAARAVSALTAAIVIGGLVIIAMVVWTTFAVEG